MIYINTLVLTVYIQNFVELHNKYHILLLAMIDYSYNKDIFYVNFSGTVLLEDLMENLLDFKKQENLPQN